MATQRGEKIKLYLVIALLLAAAVVAYFRFFHKAGGPAAPVAPSPPPAPINLASAVTPSFQPPPALHRNMPEPLEEKIRNIFMPPEIPREPEPPVQAKPSPPAAPVRRAPVAPPPAPTPPLDAELKGTVVGGKEPLAIINEKFVRLGEKIGDYYVVGITSKAVYLKAGKHQKVLHVMSGATR